MSRVLSPLMSLTQSSFEKSMPKFRCNVPTLFLLVVLSLAHGCASDSFERTLYETAQNVRSQECSKDRSGRCEEKQSYDAYQRERSRVLGEPANP